MVKATSDLYHMEASITVSLHMGITVCSHMATLSQSCALTAQYAILLNVQSECRLCAALESSYTVSWGSYMKRNR